MEFQKFYSGDLFEAYSFLGAHPSKNGYVFRVYAPAAKKLSVIGNFSDWKEVPMQKIYDGQFYEAEIDHAKAGQMYKIRVYKNETDFIDHADPYAFQSEKRPSTASILCDLNHKFHDAKWMKQRTDHKHAALNIYEAHAGSWKRKKAWDGKSDPAEGWLTYTELADQIIPYLKENHYNALELMPLAEYPADESWGYQETGFFSATSRYGRPQELQYLVDQCHQNDIAVILDVVTVHFAVNDYALWNFDGTPLYEYPHPAVGYSEWGSCNFMHSRGDVRSFLQSSCMFWLEKYHFDGLRFDAVGNLIYWQGNSGRGINNDAVKFLQRMNLGLKERYPDVMLFAEDSTPFEKTTKPVSQNGLGFDYKWDLGWMNDTLKFMGVHPADRGKEIGKLLFSMDYFYTQDYLLPFSHDEVVHGKKTIVNKISGDDSTRIEQAKLLYLYMFAHPGKKLNFMGNELAQIFEWDEKKEIDREALNNPANKAFHAYMQNLNEVYQNTPALWETDYDSASFRWVSRGEGNTAVIAFTRTTTAQTVLAVLNFSDQKQTFASPLLKDADVLIRTAEPDSKKAAGSTLTLRPFEGILFKLHE